MGVAHQSPVGAPERVLDLHGGAHEGRGVEHAHTDADVEVPVVDAHEDLVRRLAQHRERPRPRPSGHLGRDDWARAALRALARGGVAAVAVEPVAQELGATKGSFSWHFANRAALLQAALELWETGRHP